MRTKIANGSTAEVIQNIWGNDLIGAYNVAGSYTARYYFLKDHLGSIKVRVAENGDVIGYDDYDPFGLTMDARSYSYKDEGYKFTGKERDAVTAYDYFGARYYNSWIGRWLSIDQLTSLHPNYTPYAYVYNNPIRLVDIAGLDSTQRANAALKATEYEKKNPGDSYPTDEQKKKGQFKGKPGETVDCSGMVNNCIVAGGEESIYKQGKSSGVQNVMSASDKVGDSVEDLTNAEVGNAVTFNNTYSTPLDPTKNDKHTGILTKLEFDSDGKILNAEVIHSSGKPGSGNSGPHSNPLIHNGKIMYWGQRITGIWKWDKIPDKK